MTDAQKRYRGISCAAWGYFFLYFNININTVSLLPAFVGYLLFLSAIGCLKEEERELTLLYTPGVIMALWTGAEWLASFAGIELEGMWQFADVIICLVNLYFHFQLLTNLASLAANDPPEGHRLAEKLLRYRTLQTVMLTAIEILVCLHPWLSEVWTGISLCMMIAYLVAGICLMRVLFALRRSLPAPAAET